MGYDQATLFLLNICYVLNSLCLCLKLLSKLANYDFNNGFNVFPTKYCCFKMLNVLVRKENKVSSHYKIQGKIIYKHSYSDVNNLCIK